MSAPPSFPLQFSTLPAGLSRLSIFDELVSLLRDGAWLYDYSVPWSKIIPGTIFIPAIKNPVVVATTVPITLSGSQTIDTVLVVAGNRVLVKDQTDKTKNGIWIVANGAWTLAPDWALPQGTVLRGTEVLVTQGDVNPGLWAVTSPDPITIPTSQIEWALIAAGGSTSSTNPVIFPTVAEAEAYGFLTRPDFLFTAFYNSGQKEASGAKYKYNGTASGDITITVNGVTHYGFDVAGPFVSASSFGLDPTGSAAANKAALQLAYDRTPEGGTLFVPDLGSACTIDTSGTGPALSVTKAIQLVIDGHLLMSDVAIQANAMSLIRFDVENWRVSGRGRVESPEAFISEPVAVGNYPAIVRISPFASYGQWTGVRVVRPPLAGIMAEWDGSLNHSESCILHDFVVEGGTPDYQPSFLPPTFVTPNPNYKGSSNFGIIPDGDDFVLQNITFIPGDDGGACAQCIQSGTSNSVATRLKIIGCKAENPWEKLAYLYGDGHIVAFNSATANSLSGFTDVCRFQSGSNNLYIGNFSDLFRGAVQALDGNRNRIIGNMFYRCRSSGVNVSHFASGSPAPFDLNYSIVSENIIDRWTDTAEQWQFGVAVRGLTDINISYHHVVDNILRGWGYAGEVNYAIEMKSIDAGNFAQASMVRGNVLVQCVNGILLSQCSSVLCSENTITGGTEIGIAVYSSANCTVSGNQGLSPGVDFLALGTGGTISTGTAFLNNRSVGATNIRIKNHTLNANNNWGQGNTWTAARLIGLATANTGSATTTVTHGGVAPHALTMMVPTSSQIANLMASAGWYTQVSSGNNFQIVFGSTPGSASEFGWEILQ